MVTRSNCKNNQARSLYRQLPAKKRAWHQPLLVEGIVVIALDGDEHSLQQSGLPPISGTGREYRLISACARPCRQALPQPILNLFTAWSGALSRLAVRLFPGPLPLLLRCSFLLAHTVNFLHGLLGFFEDAQLSQSPLPGHDDHLLRVRLASCRNSAGSYRHFFYRSMVPAAFSRLKKPEIVSKVLNTFCTGCNSPRACLAKITSMEVKGSLSGLLI